MEKGDRQRLDKNVDLRVMPQRFVMPHALDLFGDGLAVRNAPLAERHGQPEPLRYHVLQHFKLHLAHYRNVNFAQLLRPRELQLRVLLLELFQLWKDLLNVRFGRKPDFIAENRLYDRRGGGFLRTERLSRKRPRKPRHGDQLPRLGAVRGGEFRAVVQSYLSYLFARFRDNGAVFQLAAVYFHVREPCAVFVGGDLVHQRGEAVITLARLGVTFEKLQQPVHALRLQRRPEAHGENVPRRDRF